MKYFPVLILLLWTLPLNAADLGGVDPNQPQKVEVTNTPLEVTVGKNKAQVIIETDLEYKQAYQSSYLNVSEYKNVAFYVTPVRELNSSSSSLGVNAIYKLDAFFSVSSDESGYKDLDTKQTLYFYPGSQEFGSQMSGGVDGKTLSENFVKTSTGETGTRVLCTPAYGPFVRLELKNLAPGEKRKFKITAYFMT